MSPFFTSVRLCSVSLAALACLAVAAASAELDALPSLAGLAPAPQPASAAPSPAGPGMVSTGQPPSPEALPGAAGRPAGAPAAATADAPMPSQGAEPGPAAPPPEVSKLPAALDAALAALVARDVKVSPVGAGDWRAARQAIRTFYAARDFAPVWVTDQGLTARAEAALARLARADEDGLDLAAFALPKGPLADMSPERLADAETMISAAVVAYAMQASGSRLVPTRISPLITARPSVADPGLALAAVAAAAAPGETLEGFNPQQKGYRDLRDQLSRAEAPPAAPAAAPRIPSGPSLGLGMVDPRVPLVRARLGLEANGAGGDVYDLRTATAVAAFQRANGLPANGALTPATVDALSGGAPPAPARRDAMILANMEMWRWEPRAMGDERIEINIPDFSLRVMNGDDLVHQARVIVGKPDTPTPVFSNEMRYILVNPVWRVPDSIIRKEMAPKLAQDPTYLTRRGFEVSQVGDRLVVRQPPGEANALGRILFMFPNEHSVYLHDTPARALFAASRRAFSHGCVRVEQPMRLAELVMGGASAGWTTGRLQSLFGATERTVFLPHTIPIHLEYFTEFVDGSGALQDREDIYGIARRVAGTITRPSQD